jgi:D-alanine-D-alanine ligase
MKITVLYGGPSSERKISLISGQAVADALTSMGHEVYLADIMPEDLSPLDKPCDVVFPVLHGTWGESGELQEILEERGLPFVGSGSRASCLGMDKVASKDVWRKASLPTPDWQVASTLDLAVKAIHTIGLPCVVKAIDAGSSIDVYLCDCFETAVDAAKKCITTYDRVMVETLIRGKELTVGIVDDQALPPIWIDSSREFYDYTAKYEGNFTEYKFELGLPPEVVANIQQIAQKAHKALGCRHLSRVDFMIDANNNPYLLEINTLPGFTSKSLLPKAARQSGIEFGPLVDKLVKLALPR